MLMGHPSIQETGSFKKCLTLFSKYSSLQVNLKKTQIFFFNTPRVTQRNIICILGYSVGTLSSNYLGAPMEEGTIMKVSWKDILDHMRKKLSRWEIRPLNFLNRLILVNFVLQAMPNYLFSYFPAPKEILKEICNIQCVLLWGGNREKYKIDLVGWDKVYQPKDRVGLGLRDPYIISEVLGAKIWWRWCTHNNKP